MENKREQEGSNNPKDRNFDQEHVSGKSESTSGKRHEEQPAQDGYNAQDRNFDGAHDAKDTGDAAA